MSVGEGEANLNKGIETTGMLQADLEAKTEEVQHLKAEIKELKLEIEVRAVSGPSSSGSGGGASRRDAVVLVGLLTKRIAGLEARLK
mmetsp:Transcript_21005/g.62513  ORF Transcript_21005/g.62513 Transcript_21005/m.62513 type:complete len:87 (-) Transcript_21005:231-491(-)